MWIFCRLDRVKPDSPERFLDLCRGFEDANEELYEIKAEVGSDGIQRYVIGNPYIHDCQEVISIPVIACPGIDRTRCAGAQVVSPTRYLGKVVPALTTTFIGRRLMPHRRSRIIVSS